MNEQTPEGKNVPCSALLGDTLLPVGTRIRFTRTLTEDATGDHPAYIYARKGDEGEVTGHGTSEGYWVKWDKWPHAFGAGRDEFEPLMPNASLQPTAKRSVAGRLEGIVGPGGSDVC